MYTNIVYGKNDLWNVRADEGPESVDIIKALVVRDFAPKGFKIYGQFEEGVWSADVTGSFSANGTPTRLGEISGTVLTITEYENGAKASYEAWSEGGTLSDLFLPNDQRFAKELEQLVGNDWFEGSATADLSDYVQGLGGNDTFIGYGNEQWGDKFFGGAGVDTAVYRGHLAEYQIVEDYSIWDDRKGDGSRVSGYKVTDQKAGRDGLDYLNEVERLKFSDKNIALDVDGTAGQAYRLYKAAFDTAPDEPGLGYWIHMMDGGLTLPYVAQGFINSNEFTHRYGQQPSDENFVGLLYQNILDRLPDQIGYRYWIDHLNGTNGGGLNPGNLRLSHAEVLANFSESNENKANVIWKIGDRPRFML